MPPQSVERTRSQCRDLRPFVALLCSAAFSVQVDALDNGLMRTPPMGYNTWNAFHENFNESIVLHTANLMQDLGLVAAGYTYLVLDDGWPEKERDADGKLVADQKKFPSGIKALAAKIHERGMKLGIYSDAGKKTCLSYPASLGVEERDAETFAEWDIDFLKYDNCFSTDPAEMAVRTRYEAMRDALNRTGRPIAFSMCEWGVSSPWEYGSQVGNSWRTNADISLGIEAEWRGVVDNLDAVVGLSRFAGPGGWNDCDMLEVGLPGGKALTLIEQQAHFALWAIVKSPLFIGADLNSLIGSEQLAFLTAKEVIGLHQDDLGAAGDLVWKQGPKEVWAAPLLGGDRGVVLFNRHLNTDQYFQSANLSVTWDRIGLTADCQANVRDLFLEKDLGTFRNSFTATVRNHGVVVLRISPIGPNCNQHDSWAPWHYGISTQSQDVALYTAAEDCDCEMVRDLAVDVCPPLQASGKVYLLGVSAGLLVGVVLAAAYRRSHFSCTH